MVGQRHRPGDGTGGHLREEPLLLLGRADFAHHRGELRDGGQERPGGDGPPQLLDDDGCLEDGQADAAVLLGYGQGGPVEGDHGAPELLGRLARLDDGAHDIDGAFLLEERADRGTQFFLLIRELELHRTPFPALPVASPTSSGAFPGRRQIGASVPDAFVSLGVRATFAPPRFLGRTWLGVRWGVAGPRRKPGPAARGGWGGRSPALANGGRSPTLCGAPLAQRQSNGLLIRRFRVRIPRGALRGAHSVSLPLRPSRDVRVRS